MDAPVFQKEYRGQFSVLVKQSGWEGFKLWVEDWENELLEEQRAIVSDPHDIAMHNQRSGALVVLEKIKYIDVEVHETLSRIMEHEGTVEIRN